ncbi:MAG TPA: hypothetical protein VIQ54_05030 [Polyangia bacterium]|jgi:hypothetical protein
MGRRSLPQVVIPVPCHVDWNTMTPIDGPGRTRFCGSCERPVYDSASMTRDELFELIARHEGRRLPCVRLHRRPDGTIVTRDCFAPLVRVGRFLWVKVGLAAVAFWSTVFAFWSSARRPAQTVIEWDARAEPETRKVPFLIKPPDDSADWEDVLARYTRKAQVEGAEANTILGALKVDEPLDTIFE